MSGDFRKEGRRQPGLHAPEILHFLVYNPCYECGDYTRNRGMECSSNTRYNRLIIISGCQSLPFLYLGAKRGVLNDLMHSINQVMSVDPTLGPESDVAIYQFESHGGQFTVFSPFGQDPLHEGEDLIKLQEEDFYERFPDLVLFHTVVNGDYSLFREGLLYS